MRRQEEEEKMREKRRREDERKTRQEERRRRGREDEARGTGAMADGSLVPKNRSRKSASSSHKFKNCNS